MHDTVRRLPVTPLLHTITPDEAAEIVDKLVSQIKSELSAAMATALIAHARPCESHIHNIVVRTARGDAMQEGADGAPGP